ncbi:MAG: DUF6666 family protein [Thermoguttaceae bacterium]
MRFLLHLTAAALLVATGIGGMTSATAADREARTAVLGRQKIREELSAALAKGYLTRMDQYHLLLHAKEVLSEDDLRGLEKTLNRIATQQAIARGTTAMLQSAVPVAPSSRDGEPEIVTPSAYEEPKAGEAPAIGEPQPTRANALNETPFVEEVPASIGKPAIHLDGEDPEACECDQEPCRSRFRWINVELFSAVDGFKGPLDIGNANGNFGLRFGANAAVPIFSRLGVGLQAGTSTVLSNLKGSPYPEPNATIRYQVFATVGLFQRINRDDAAFTWGFVYDWLFDNYYDDLEFGQWRLKAAWEFDPCNEIGISAAVPDHGSSGTIPNFLGGFDVLSFKPIAQGYLYWKHTWDNDASLTGRVGVAERPGEFVFGGESRVPVTKHLALTGDFSYIMPNAAGGAVGQTQEIWNVSFGIEFVPGGFGRSCAPRFRPFQPVADNGSLAVRELGE